MFNTIGLKMRERVGEQEYILFAYLFKLFLIWLSWKGIIWVLGEQSTPMDERVFPGISAVWEKFNYQTVLFLLDQSKNVLEALGYEAYYSGRRLWVAGYGGIGMGNYCIGFQLIYYYILLVLIASFSLKKKLLGIASGIVITMVLNVLRTVGLCLIDVHIPEYMFLAHDHIFNIIVFGTLIGFYVLLNRGEDRVAGRLEPTSVGRLV